MPIDTVDYEMNQHRAGHEGKEPDMRDRDRYENHTYSESRDRGWREHAAQDLAYREDGE